MALSIKLKHPFIWLKRFRFRKGYGVHSPFAFQLITNVIYEHSPYYAYSFLGKIERQLRKEKEGKKLFDTPLKVRRLLFRLANYVYPATIIDCGDESTSSLYIRNVCSRTEYYRQTNILSSINICGSFFLYIHSWKDACKVSRFIRSYIEKADADSVIVIQGIGYTKEMRNLWKRLKKDKRVGITFDLYDAGLIFFDHTKVKQHYIVNF